MRKLILLSLLTLSLQVTAKSNSVNSVIDIEDNVSGELSNEGNQTLFTNKDLNTWFWAQNNQNLQIKNISSVFQKQVSNFSYTATEVYNQTDTEKQVNAAYINGRFSAQTGYLIDQNEAAKFFVQSSYLVFTNYKLNITVTAKIEALDTERVQHYYGVINPNVYISDTNTNATLGLIGTYELSPKWTIIGALTSTALANDIADSPLIEHNKYNMALIGTTYSF
ncbi:MAG: MipA/OmpV family protein [Colwellia sp.]|nr:MipA/OmpV family protein [Colwellia sp.]